MDNSSFSMLISSISFKLKKKKKRKKNWRNDKHLRFISVLGDFPGTVVKSSSNAGGASSISVWGAKMLQAAQCSKKKRKKKKKSEFYVL